MNDKLDQEIKSLLSNVIIDEAKGDVEYAARKFYNLALEDVKKKIEDKMPKPHICGCSTIQSSEICGERTAYNEILNFIINRLNK